MLYNTIIDIFHSLLLKLNLLYSLLLNLIMYNSYHFNNKERNNEKKYIYIFISDLLNITIPYITVIGTILLIAFLI